MFSNVFSAFSANYKFWYFITSAKPSIITLWAAAEPVVNEVMLLDIYCVVSPAETKELWTLTTVYYVCVKGVKGFIVIPN